MSTQNNKRHALCALKAMLASYDVSELEFESSFVDILTDLRHLANSKGVQFSEALRMSEIHYNAEINGDDLETHYNAEINGDD